MPEIPVVSLEAIRREIDAAGERTYERARTHSAKNTAQSVLPLQEKVSEHERFLRGDGSDTNLGLVTQTRLNTQRLTTMEQAQNRIEAGIGDKLEALSEDIRTLTGGGRTPRDGIPVIEIPGRREKPEEKDDAIGWNRIAKRFWPLAVLLFFGGPSAVTAVLQAWMAPPQQAVQVQAEAVATMRAQTAQELQGAREVAAEAAASAEQAKAAREALERRERAVEAKERELRARPVGTE